MAPLRFLALAGCLVLASSDQQCPAGAANCEAAAATPGDVPEDDVALLQREGGAKGALGAARAEGSEAHWPRPPPKPCSSTTAEPPPTTTAEENSTTTVATTTKAPVETYFIPTFGPVNITTPASSLTKALKSLPGVIDAKILSPGEPGYEEAFWPNKLYFNRNSIFGDKGYTELGYGGVATYNVARIRTNKRLKLYRMTNDVSAPYYGCSQWWASASTFNTDLVQASINVATCNDYPYFLECTMDQEFIALVGQGGQLSYDASVSSRKCTPEGEVQKVLIETDAYPLTPKDNIIQFVFPGCYRALKCKWCDLNTENVLDSTRSKCTDFPVSPSAPGAPPYANDPAFEHR